MPCFPRSPEMQLGDRDSSVPTGLVSSGLSSEGPSQNAAHDTGSLMSQASRLTDLPSDTWETEGGPLAGAGHVVVVKAKGAVIDSVDPGTFLCPDSATRNPKIIFEVPPPGPNIGAGDDNAAAKLPPPLTLPGSWTLVAPAGSEELGAPLSTGPGVDALLPTPTMRSSLLRARLLLRRRPGSCVVRRLHGRCSRSRRRPTTSRSAPWRLARGAGSGKSSVVRGACGVVACAAGRASCSAAKRADRCS